MENKQKALKKLRQYTQSGKSYAEATALLINEGFSRPDIDDATSAFRANKDKVEENPELAKSIVSAESIKAADTATEQSRKGLHFYYPGGGLPMMSTKENLPLWVYAIGIVLALAALVYFLK